MADDDTTDATEESAPESTHDKQVRPGVTVPFWALAVVAALAIGGIGYAIGHDANDSNTVIAPIADVRSPRDGQGNGHDEGERGACPRPLGGPDGRQLQPGGPGGNGPGRPPDGPLGPRGHNEESESSV